MRLETLSNLRHLKQFETIDQAFHFFPIRLDVVIRHVRLPQFSAGPVFKEQEDMWVLVILVQIVIDTAFLCSGGCDQIK